MTLYVRIAAGAIIDGPRALPATWTRPDGQRVRNYHLGPAEMHAADGWRECPDTPIVDSRIETAALKIENGIPAWEIVSRPIEDVRSEVYATVTPAHLRKMADGCEIVLGETGSVRFFVDCEDVDIIRWNSLKSAIEVAAQLGAPLATVEITDFHQTDRTLAVADFWVMLAQITAHVDGLWSWKRSVRAEITAATTSAEIVAIAEREGLS